MPSKKAKIAALQAEFKEAAKTIDGFDFIKDQIEHLDVLEGEGGGPELKKAAHDWIRFGHQMVQRDVPSFESLSGFQAVLGSFSARSSSFSDHSARFWHRFFSVLRMILVSDPSPSNC